MSDKRFLCKVGWHKSEDLETQSTKNICFGYIGCELPGLRVVRGCKHCGKLSYLSLNLAMPNKYLYQEKIWRSKGTCQT